PCASLMPPAFVCSPCHYSVGVFCFFSFACCGAPLAPPSFPTRRSSDLDAPVRRGDRGGGADRVRRPHGAARRAVGRRARPALDPDRKSNTSELQSRENLVCRLLLEKKKHRQNDDVASAVPHSRESTLKL